MGLLDRARALLTRQKSDGGTGVINWTSQGGIPTSWPSNWFQLGYRPLHQQGGSVIEACIGAYARTVAQLPGRHYRTLDDGSREYLTTSRLSNVLHKPNDYQTISDLLLNLVYQLYHDGNSYLVMSEDGESIHLLNSRDTTANRVSETGDVFYSTGGLFAEQIGLETQVMIPSRYIGHFRLHTPVDPLIGITPVQNAALSVAANHAMSGHQASFFTNMSRPSGVLTTDMDLSKEQMQKLREAWEDQAAKLNSGGVPILANGLKWDTMSSSNRDAELVEALKFTVEDISRVFAVPLMLINSMENATFDNAETLMRFWLASGLGFLVNHIEQTLAAMYRLPKGQGVELNQDLLLQADLQARMEALGTGVTKGILAPNEGRSILGYKPVEGGDQPFIQQQNVPLSAAATGVQLIPSNATPPPPDDDDDETMTDDELAFVEYLVRGRKYAA